MRKTKRLWVWGIVLAIAAGGCSGMGKPQDRVDYYVLEYEAPAFQALEPVQAVIRLERFSVAPAYNTDRIVYRESAFERNTYNYHRWRANPGDMVGYFLARDLRESGLFRAVLPQDTRFSASCVLEGIVEEFYERDGPEQWEAVLALSVTLIAEGEPDVSRRVLHQNAYREVEPCVRRNPKSVSEAMSRAMERISKRIVMDLHRALSMGG
ncbi:MAG: PqiC family protein [Deltaproteobacteria bacterium]|nr:PqiC family protein [Deltaproteobacteria bacterium]